ncbi:MAG: hypothetical protein JKY96_02685 [Phycisphaerales bacterium]|nr:hypothetical protein [Phycisphaerales bacterium]
MHDYALTFLQAMFRGSNMEDAGAYMDGVIDKKRMAMTSSKYNEIFAKLFTVEAFDYWAKTQCDLAKNDVDFLVCDTVRKSIFLQNKERSRTLIRLNRMYKNIKTRESALVPANKSVSSIRKRYDL